MLGRIIHIVNIFSTINIFKTVCFNYKVFPWNIAKNLPVFVGWNVDIHKWYRGCMEFLEGIQIRRGIVSLEVRHFQDTYDSYIDRKPSKEEFD